MIVAEVEEKATRQEAAASNPADAGSNPALSPRIAGAVYDEDGMLQLGCLVCAATMPAKLAKSRSKTCSPECAKSLRYMRDRNNLVPQYLNELRKGKISAEAVMRRLEGLAGTGSPRKLSCQVCRGRIPAAMAERMSVTCGQECRNELRRYRVQVVKAQKCPHCYHPSSPAEWEQFRQWRASLGPMQAFMQLPGRGNLAGKREKALRNALKDAKELVEGYLVSILAKYGLENMEPMQEIDKIDTTFFDQQQERDYENNYSLTRHLAANIADFEALLIPQKKLIDTGGAE